MDVHPLNRRVVGNILATKAREYPNRVFLRFRDRHFTYAEVDRTANRVANSLAALGIGKGDKVCIMLPNSPEFVMLSFGLARLGAVEVPINTAYKGELLHYVIHNSEARLLVVDMQWVDRVAPVLDRLPNLERIVVYNAKDDRLPDLPRPVMGIRNLVLGSPDPPSVALRHSDLLAIMYTSGTTGPSKGVMVSHCHAITFAYDWLAAHAYASEDVLYTPLPLFHAIAHTLGVLAVMLVGSEIAIVERFSASEFWRDVRRFNATVAHGIFSIVPILLNQPPSPDDRNHRLRCLYFGPSGASASFEERFGAKIIEVYGSTETGIVTCAPYGVIRPGACGLENTRTFAVKIVDDDDNELPPGQVGEIVVRPRHPFAMMSGYYNMPEATTQAYRNLWFHTGDQGYRDTDGYFYFVDRKKDAIRRRGENISSYDVERVVNMHPSVLESAAIAVPSDMYEDEVKVCVVLKPAHTLDPLDLIKFLDERLPQFMVPRYIEFMPELPKTPNQKVEKYKLRATGDRGVTSATWDREKSGYRLRR